MANAISRVPVAINEPVKSYTANSPERAELLAMYDKMHQQEPIDIPMYIGSEKVYTSNKKHLTSPHDHKKLLAHYNVGDAKHVEVAIEKALAAKAAWSALPWEERAAVFL